MNIFRPAHTLADYVSRTACAGLWVMGINGYIFTDQHPDLAFKVALYGALAMFVLYGSVVAALNHFQDTEFRLRDNIITTSVMCWALPGIILTPPSHIEILFWIAGIFMATTFLIKPLFHLAADRHDHRADLRAREAHMPAPELMENNR